MLLCDWLTSVLDFKRTKRTCVGMFLFQDPCSTWDLTWTCFVLLNRSRIRLMVLWGHSFDLIIYADVFFFTIHQSEPPRAEISHDVIRLMTSETLIMFSSSSFSSSSFPQHPPTCCPHCLLSFCSSSHPLFAYFYHLLFLLLLSWPLQ